MVEELSVAYPGRLALDGVSLRVAPGEIVAVTGPSGCGKSTLLGVILGLVAPSGGGVRYGGIDLAELDPDAWRSRIAWVPQRPYLLAGTVTDNVRLARADATPAEIRAALALAGLARVPLELRLGEGGTGLSAGERRRIALARAFLRDAPLLLLDEPTASLDGATERGVLAAMRRLAEGRTVIVVAHRPALVEFAGREIVLPELRPRRDEGGRVSARARAPRGDVARGRFRASTQRPFTPADRARDPARRRRGDRRRRADGRVRVAHLARRAAPRGVGARSRRRARAAVRALARRASLRRAAGRP